MFQPTSLAARYMDLRDRSRGKYMLAEIRANPPAAIALLAVLAVLALVLVWRALRHRRGDRSVEDYEPDELQHLILSTLLPYYPGSVPLELLHRLILAARPDLPSNPGGQARTGLELKRLEAARLVEGKRKRGTQFGLSDRGRDWICAHPEPHSVPLLKDEGPAPG